MIQIPEQKFKDILVAEGLIGAADFDALAAEAKRLNQNVRDVLISEGIITEDYFYRFLASYLNVATIDLSKTAIDENVLKKLSPELARQKRVILFAVEPDATFDAAMEDPSDLSTIEFLSRHLKAKIRPFLAKPSDLERGFAVYGGELAKDFKKIIEENIQSSLKIKEEKIEEVVERIPIVAIVDNFIAYAMSLRATDIHIEILEDKVLVRFRIDGVLYEIITIPKEVQPAILARIKLLAALKIDEHSKPQDGRFRYKSGNEVIDLRVAIMPTLYGEKIEMRLLPAAQKPLSLEELGMFEDHQKLIKENLQKTYGMFLVCGPTGCGKTTTLYSLLNTLNKPEVNIVTIEDPIEYNIKYVNQTQVNPQYGISFANGLRAIVRQDPNIIMVGEIRDNETAEIATHAALTGHLLLSSLHTNDAVTSIFRLIELNVPRFLAAAVLNIVIAQRLVRRICLDCIESYPAPPDLKNVLEEEKKSLNLPGEFRIPKILYRGKGCMKCNNSGYYGRMGIFEILDVDSDMRALVGKSTLSLNDLYEGGRKKGMITMFEDGMRKVELGMTTIEEILKVIRE